MDIIIVNKREGWTRSKTHQTFAINYTERLDIRGYVTLLDNPVKGQMNRDKKHTALIVIVVEINLRTIHISEQRL